MKAEEKVRLFIPQAAWDKGDDAMITIELLDFLNVYDLKDDGNLMKKIIRQGFGYERCGYKDEIKINIKISQGETVLFEAPEYNMVLNDEDSALFEILKSMKIKEESECTCKYDYFAANHKTLEGQAELVDQSDPVVYVNVLDMLKVEDMYLDGTFYKRIVTNGWGKSLPNTNAIVRVHYKLETEGKIWYNNFDEEHFTFVMDGDDVPSLWIHCLR